MASNDQQILEEVLSQLRNAIAPDSSDEDYFEVFCAEQILKDFDLTYDDLQAGVVDGEHDGGVDSAYCFVNGALVHDDFDCSPFKRDVEIRLHMIQSKTSSGFQEATLNSLISMTNHLLRLDANYSELPQYNASVKAVLDNFRQVYRTLASKFPSLEVHYHYASKVADTHIHANLRHKAEELEGAAQDLLVNANVRVHFLGARCLLELARRRPRTTHELRVTKNLSDVNGYIVLSRLDEYARFLEDSEGGFRAELFDSNVRDFQGNTEVNAEIINTLQKEKGIDFWWMNNGVTILASRATLNGDTVTIESPQIVNGLQTSTQIAKHCSANSSDDRKVMVKIVSSENEETRDKIIKATNRQNPIQPATLRATDKIQRDIESALKSVGLFYDRRKNYYKNESKPLSKIISIPLMAQSVMSVILGRPDSARARPSSLIKSDQEYARVFSEKYPIGVYTKTAELIRRVDLALRRETEIRARDRTNLRFYVLFWLAAVLAERLEPRPSDIAKLDLKSVGDAEVRSAIDEVRKLYKKLGENDQVAKGSELRSAVVDGLRTRLESVQA